MSENFALAVRSDGETNVYQLTYDISWENFEAMLKCVLEKERIAIKYVDEENDEVSLNSEAELAEAKSVARKSENTMNITVEVLPEGLASAAATAMPMATLQDSSGSSAATTPTSEPSDMEMDTSDNAVIIEDVMEKDGPLQECAPPKTERRFAQRKPKCKRKHYYAALAEEVGKSRAKTDGEKARQSTSTKSQPNTESTEDTAEAPPPKWIKQEFRKMVPQIVQGVLRGLNGAVIESVHGTSGIPPHVPPPPPPPPPHVPPPPPPIIPVPPPPPPPPIMPVPLVGASADCGPTRRMYCHYGIVCDNCDQTIVGVRYKCGNCADFDLCEQCEVLEGVHNEEHVFLKLNRPAIGAGRDGNGELKPLLNSVIYNDNQGIPIYISRRCTTYWWQNKTNKFEKRTEKREKKVEKLAEKLKKQETLKDKCERKIEKLKEKYERKEEKMKRRFEAKESVMPSKKEKMEDTSLDVEDETSPLISPAYTKLLDKMDAAFVKDGNMPDDTHVQPGTKFIKHWVLKNKGTLAWNADTKLKLLWGSIDIMCSPEVEVPPVPPNKEGTVSVEFQAPTMPGIYQSHWRMCQGEEEFGHRLWCSIIVDEPEMLEPPSPPVMLSEKEDVQCAEANDEVIEEIIPKDDQPQTSASAPQVEDIELNQPQTSSPTPEVEDEEEFKEERDDIILQQDLLNFELLDIHESSTPNNTPIDLTPRISPLPQLDENLLKEQISKCSASSCNSSVEIIDMPDNENEDQEQDQTAEDVSVTDGMEHLEINSELGELVDDTASNASDSSHGTLEDFCVVPLPECFDRTIPLDRSETRSSLSSRSDFESSLTDSGVVGSTEVEKQTVDEILATSQSDTHHIPLTPVTLTSCIAPPLVSTLTVAISNTNVTTRTTTEALPSAPLSDQGVVLDDTQGDIDGDEDECNDNETVENNDVEDGDDVTPGATGGDTQGDSSGDTQGEASDDTQGATGGDTQGEANGDVQGENEDSTAKRPTIEGVRYVELGENGELGREEPAFDPVRAMEYAGELAVQAISAAARTGGNVVHAIFNNQKVPPQPDWPKETGTRSPMDQLIDMGFCNRELNQRLLDKHNNNMERVVQDLLAEADNDWHSNRH